MKRGLIGQIAMKKHSYYLLKYIQATNNTGIAISSLFIGKLHYLYYSIIFSKTSKLKSYKTIRH